MLWRDSVMVGWCYGGMVLWEYAISANVISLGK